MAENPPRPSHPSTHPSAQQEHEFWDRQFDDRVGRASSRRPRPPRDGLTTRMLDRLRDLQTDARAGVVLLVGIAIIAGVIWYRIGVGGADTGETTRPARTATPAPIAEPDTSTATSTAATTGTTTGPTTTGTAKVASKAKTTTIAVHVAGAVVHPGVVELAPGSRVIDALEAVGGALPEGDLDRLNLAAKLADAQRVFVAKVGQADPGTLDGGGAAPEGSSPSPSTKVNLNTATQAQLEQLPGIGPTYALAIIAERQRRGGFKSVNELRSVHGIGDKRFAELASLVTV